MTTLTVPVYPLAAQVASESQGRINVVELALFHLGIGRGSVQGSRFVAEDAEIALPEEAVGLMEPPSPGEFQIEVPDSVANRARAHARFHFANGYAETVSAYFDDPDLWTAADCERFIHVAYSHGVAKANDDIKNGQIGWSPTHEYLLESQP